MTVPIVAFSVVMSDVRAVTSVVSVIPPISRVRAHADRFLDVQLHSVLRDPEAVQFGFDQVCAGRHRRKGVGADLVAVAGYGPRWWPMFCAVTVAPGMRGAGGVFHFTGDGAQSLSTRGSPKNHANEYAQDPFHHAPLLDAC